MRYRLLGEPGNSFQLTRRDERCVEALEDVCRKWLALYLRGIGDEPDGRYEITVQVNVMPREAGPEGAAVESHSPREKLFEFSEGLRKALDCRPQFGEEVAILTREEGERLRVVREE